MYLATCTRPNISYAVSYLSQFNTCFNSSHWTAAKRVLRYLKGTSKLGLVYRRTGKPIVGYANWTNCLLDRKLYSGYAFILNGSAVSWESRKQRTVALSSTESEYMALTEAAKQATYLRYFILQIGFPEIADIKVFCDNMALENLPKIPSSIIGPNILMSGIIMYVKSWIKEYLPSSISRLLKWPQTC